MKRRVALTILSMTALIPAAVRKFEFRYVLGREQDGALVPVSPRSPFDT